MAARTSLALQGLFHPAADRVLDWDVRRAPEVLARPGVLAGLGESGRLLEPRLGGLAAAAEATKALPSGLQHADVTLTNVLATEGTVTGLIDFGDMHHTAAVCDLAVTLTSVLRNTADVQLHDVWELTAATLLGYQRHRQLTAAEIDVLGDLVLARLGLTLAIAARRVVTEVDNIDYIGQYDDRTRVVLAQWCDEGPDVLTDRLHRMAGPAADRRPATSSNADSVPWVGHSRRCSTTSHSRSCAARGRGSSLPTAPATSTPTTTSRSSGTPIRPSPMPSHDSSRSSTPTAATSTRGSWSWPSGCSPPSRQDSTPACSPPPAPRPTSWPGGWRPPTPAATPPSSPSTPTTGPRRGWPTSSPNEWPAGYRPAHVATFAAPRPATGGTDRATASGRIAAAADDLTRAGDRPALVLADIGFTSEGILDAPAEFLAGLVDGAHRAGALFLADEVQSGFGRSGPQLWRFAAARITPDFVTLGKPMGAGYPIGAVITRREIADSLARDHEYFSTFAATPVAAAAASVVLDVLESNRLPESAMRVGAHLRGRLRELAGGSSVLGEVRGVGLLAGIDLVAPECVADRDFAATVRDGLRHPRRPRRADRTHLDRAQGAAATRLARGARRPFRRRPRRDTCSIHEHAHPRLTRSAFP